MSHGPMRGSRYTGGCSCCGGDNPPTRAAEQRIWARELDAELAEYERLAAEQYAKMIGAGKPVAERAKELRRLSEGAPVVVVKQRMRPNDHADA